MKNLLFFLLLVIAPQAFAGPFDPPPTDQSVNLLGVIFGSSIGSIPLGGSPNPVLSDLMEKFNFIMVVIATIIVTYVSILSIINTANEGTSMGKKWSAVWLPMRSVLGMALMIPAPASGYSMIQVTVMWIIVQGIGAADILWDIALDGLSNNMSITTGTTVGGSLEASGNSVTFEADAKTLILQLLNAKTCMSTLYQQATTAENQNQNLGAGSTLANIGTQIAAFSVIDENNPTITTYSTTDPANPVPAICDGSNQANVTYAKMSGTLFFGVKDGSSDEQQICGSVKVTGSVCSSEFETFTGVSLSDNDLKDIASSIYYTKLNMLDSLLTVLQPLAEGFAKGDYIQLEGSDEISTKPPPTGFIDQAITQYTNMMGGLAVELPSGFSTTDTKLQQQITLGRQNGWIAAGSYYFVFNQTLANQLYKSATLDRITMEATIPECTENNCESQFPVPIKNIIAADSTDMNRLEEMLIMANSYYQIDQSAKIPKIFRAPSNVEGADDSEVAAAMGEFSSINTRAIQDINNLLTGSDSLSESDPLLKISYFGRNVMLGIEASILSAMSIALVVAAFTLFPPAIGLPMFNLYFPNVSTFMQTKAIQILGILGTWLPVIVVIWAYAAMLAVYLPLIPFMIFVMAAVGWFLTVVEAIIAAPIVAIGFILPAGDELGKIEGALNILANVFLRPMLMIFGFFLASRVFKAIVLLVNFGMGGVFATIDVSTLFSTLIIIAVYATFIISLANTCFSLIHALPDKILRWIGGSPGEHTDTSPVNQAKEAAKDAAQNISDTTKDIGKEMGKRLEGGLTAGINETQNAIAQKAREKAEKEKQKEMGKKAASDAAAAARKMMEERAKKKDKESATGAAKDATKNINLKQTMAKAAAEAAAKARGEPAGGGDPGGGKKNI